MVHVIDQARCIKCGMCLEVCPERFGAVVKLSGETMDVPRGPIPVKEKSKATAA
jgi:NADH-quinone oxidoreductase subunit F